jgi:hypothetical protein
MRTSEAIDQLATALASAQSEMKNAKLNKVNPHFKSKYADLAEIRDTVTPALSKHGIAVVNGTDATEGGLHVVTRLIHKSGQWIESRFPIAYDKPQTMGSAITYGKRYNLAAVANIAADEDDDANAANDKPAPPPVMLAASGTPGASKAGSRDTFSKLVKEIRQAASVTTLKAWYQSNVTTIDALPPDFLDELRVEYNDRQSELKASVAA